LHGGGDDGVDDSEAKSESVLSFMEALHVSETMRAFMLTSLNENKHMSLI
jgi:hypothetical protein